MNLLGALTSVRIRYEIDQNRKLEIVRETLRQRLTTRISIAAMHRPISAGVVFQCVLEICALTKISERISASTVLASASLSAITPQNRKINALNLKPQREYGPGYSDRRAFHPSAGAVVAEQILQRCVNRPKAQTHAIPRYQAPSPG